MAEPIERSGDPREVHRRRVFAVFGWPVAHETTRPGRDGGIDPCQPGASPRTRDERSRSGSGPGDRGVVAADRAGTRRVRHRWVRDDLTAARLQSVAGPGRDPRRRGDVSGRSRSVGGRRSWGTVVCVASPIRPLYALATRSSRSGRYRAAAHPRSGHSSGGPGNSARLRRILARAASGVGATILIVGDAGMGKSRLVAELNRMRLGSATAGPGPRSVRTPAASHIVSPGCFAQSAG